MCAHVFHTFLIKPYLYTAPGPTRISGSASRPVIDLLDRPLNDSTPTTLPPPAATHLPASQRASAIFPNMVDLEEIVEER